MPKVYLAGPISGLSYRGCTDWREYARQRLAEHGIQGLSPMRAKEFLANITKLSHLPETQYAHLGEFAKSHAIMTRDSWDVHRSDAILAHLAGATQVSVGTVMEIAWGWKAGKPIVATMCEATGVNPHDHGMVNQAIGFKANTLDEALDLMIGLFCHDR